MKKIFTPWMIALTLLLLLAPAGCRTNEKDAVEIIRVFKYTPGMSVPPGGWGTFPADAHPEWIQWVFNPGDRMYIGLRISERIDKEITFSKYTFLNEVTGEEVTAGSADDLGPFGPGQVLDVAFNNSWPVPDVPGTYKLNIYWGDAVIASARFEVAPATPDSFYPTSANITAANGLNLSLSVNTTSLYFGDKISYTLVEKNTLTKENNLPTDDLWPIEGLTIRNRCGTINYPFGIAVFQGSYSAANVTSAVPLQLFDPNGLTSCPPRLAGITAYNFQPESDAVDIYDKYNDHSFPGHMTAAGIPIDGFWTGSENATFSYFTPGTYTIAAADEWGAVVVLHFVVSTAPALSPTPLISREQAIETAIKTLPSSIVVRADISAEFHVWYWEIAFDNLHAMAGELMPYPLKPPPPPPAGQPTVNPYPGIWQSVIITINAETGDLKSAGAQKAPEPGPYVSREQAIQSARERMLETPTGINWGVETAWFNSAQADAYLRGDRWIVLFWETGSRENRFILIVNAVTGEAMGGGRG